MSERSLEVKNGMFSRWLFAWLEQLACGVLMLLNTIDLEIDLLQYSEEVSVLGVLADTEWQLPYFSAIVLFFVAVALMGVPLFAPKFRKSVVLIGMFAVSVAFTALNTTAFVMLGDIIREKTFYGLRYEFALTPIGCIYLVVSVFAILELVLTFVALMKSKASVSNEKSVIETPALERESDD